MTRSFFPMVLLLTAPVFVHAQWHRTVDEPLRSRQVHLDFHTSEFIEDIGGSFSKEQFQRALQLGRVNHINIFAKGHHGWSYYPTGVGERHPHLDFDLLGAQIEACHEIGVNCPLYFTVGWSVRDAELHPEWCARAADGSFIGDLDPGAAPDEKRPHYSWKLLCPSGGYHRQIMEQVREICLNYQVDGLWFDIYQVNHGCYCERCTRRMRERNIDITDHDAVVAHFASVYKEHMRDLRRLVAEYHPGATVFFNGTTSLARSDNIRHSVYRYNTHQDLEDLPTTWGGYDKMPLQAKYFLCRGTPIVAMSGKFHKAWGEFGGFKYPDAIKYEAAAMISFGAACNFGDQLHPGGEMDMETYRNIGEAYRYVEQIEDYGPGGMPVSRLGLWFSGDFEADQGLTNMLLEMHYDFNLANEKNIDSFEAILVPSSSCLTAEQGERIEQFARAKGGVIVLERGALERHASVKGVPGEPELPFVLDTGAGLAGESEYDFDYTVLKDSTLLQNTVKSPFLNYLSGLWTRPDRDTRVLAQIRNPYFNRTYEKYSSHRETPYQLNDSGYPAVTRKGNIIFFAHALDRLYYHHGVRLHRELLKNAIDLIYRRPMVRAGLPSAGRVSLLHQPRQRRYIVHLLYSPPLQRGEVRVIEDLVPLYRIPVHVDFDRKIKSARLEPEHRDLVLEADGNGYRVVVPEFTCHCCVVFDY